MKSDLESYLSLIRRRIQERCSTTNELIQQIRRNKISEASAVTPGEFRFTLIKFGIILDQEMVDTIFSVFDSDRSGTMDFDEFAMWIMNSEFQPVKKGMAGKPNKSNGEEEAMLIKFQRCVTEHHRVFSNMNKSVSIIEFIADIHRKNMDLTEREARKIFQKLDPNDTGYVDTAVLVKFGKTGKIELPVPPRSGGPTGGAGEDDIDDEDRDLLLRKIVGRNTNALESAFSHVKRGSGTRIPFEEFRRCLLNAGVGKGTKDVKMLYAALGGKKYGGANIDTFFDNLAPMIVDVRTEVSAKKVPSAAYSTSRADRSLRDSMRKVFPDVKTEIEKLDPSKSGFISSEKLYRILTRNCCPITMQDYRFIIQNIDMDTKLKTEPRVDYNQFLTLYNPTKPPHQLSGLEGFRGIEQRNDLMTKRTATSDLRPKSNVSDDNRYDDIDHPSSPLMKSSGFKKDAMKKVWQDVLRQCHKSDPKRAGHISRVDFIGALERANFNQAMSPEAMNRLADNYTISSGLVNYLLCFRSYLGDLAASKTIKATQAAEEEADTIRRSPPKQLKPLNGSTHPWEFDYERSPAGAAKAPYWKGLQAKNMEKWKKDMALQTSYVPPPNETLTIRGGEKEILLNTYSAEVQEVCTRCYRLITHNWRTLRNEFKKAQVPSIRGSINAVPFISILEKNSVMIDKNDLKVILRTFREPGGGDVIRFDEFIRACLVKKDSA